MIEKIQTRRFCVSMLLMILASGHVLAQAIRNPDGFNVPEGYKIVSFLETKFGVSGEEFQFKCLPTAKLCNEENKGFDSAGKLTVDGLVEKTQYVGLDGKAINGYLIQKVYDKTILAMGGKLIAEKAGEDKTSGDMVHIYRLDNNSQSKWIIVDTYRNRDRYSFTVLTASKLPDILPIGEFQKQLETQGYVTLNVNFDNNKSAIRTEDKPTLNQVVQLLKASPKLRLSVDGHTDNVGNAAANKTLSQQRSEAIVAYLVGEGIEKSRLVAKGFGSENPIADNRSEDGRAKNRRVELVKLK
jgi:OmpA-OmpF porin, OOP family